MTRHEGESRSTRHHRRFRNGLAVAVVLESGYGLAAVHAGNKLAFAMVPVALLSGGAVVYNEVGRRRES